MLKETFWKNILSLPQAHELRRAYSWQRFEYEKVVPEFWYSCECLFVGGWIYYAQVKRLTSIPSSINPLHTSDSRADFFVPESDCLEPAGSARHGSWDFKNSFNWYNVYVFIFQPFIHVDGGLPLPPVKGLSVISEIMKFNAHIWLLKK